MTIPVVSLKEGAWFGDYPIMAMIRTKFELRAQSKPNKQGGDIIKISDQKIQVFKLDKDVLLSALLEFPEFKQWLFYRAMSRRIYWRKVFEENRN